MKYFLSVVVLEYKIGSMAGNQDMDCEQGLTMQTMSAK